MEEMTQARVELAWLRTLLTYKTPEDLRADDAAFAECGRVYSSESESHQWCHPLYFQN